MSRERPALTGADPQIGRNLDNVLIIGTHQGASTVTSIETQLDEVEELCRTLGARVIGREQMALREPHPATFFRTGAVERIASEVAALDFPAVVCNDALSPRQQHNLEREWKAPVLDRTEVILAIFAKRARTAEGKIQVEMAQLEHMLPRLAGGWTHLERQRGGVGLRGGPGETQIEVDRRIIRQRIARLRKRLAIVERQRSTRRQARTSVPLASVALVGYTNAGKSTLLNALTHSEVFADNLLFATLDPTSRRLELPSGRRVILTDTVGFIQKLPTELVEAFASTLEEVTQAHALLIVVDPSHPNAVDHLDTVLTTLHSMGCEQPCILALTKADLVHPSTLDHQVAEMGALVDTEPLVVSARTREGLDSVRRMLDEIASTVVPDTPANRPILRARATEQ